MRLGLEVEAARRADHPLDAVRGFVGPDRHRSVGQIGEAELERRELFVESRERGFEGLETGLDDADFGHQPGGIAALALQPPDFAARFVAAALELVDLADC